MKKHIRTIFSVVYLLLLVAVPFVTIYKSNHIQTAGNAFRFKVMPVDPYDPFRGAYVTLRFEQRRVFVSNRKGMKGTKEVFVIIDEDENGFAIVKDVVKDKPNIGSFLKTELQYQYPRSIEEGGLKIIHQLGYCFS